MTTLSAIKQAQLQARKEKRSADAASLTTLIGEAEMIGKNDGNRASTDAEVVAVIKKFIKNIDETLNVLEKDATQLAKYQAFSHEKELLLSFMPTQLTEDQLRSILGNYVQALSDKSPKNMGKVLGALKEKYAGQYDGALASKIAKELLAI